jgi:hypothetical protein
MKRIANSMLKIILLIDFALELFFIEAGNVKNSINIYGVLFDDIIRYMFC